MNIYIYVKHCGVKYWWWLLFRLQNCLFLLQVHNKKWITCCISSLLTAASHASTKTLPNVFLLLRIRFVVSHYCPGSWSTVNPVHEFQSIITLLKTMFSIKLLLVITLVIHSIAGLSPLLATLSTMLLPNCNFKVLPKSRNQWSLFSLVRHGNW